jgi:hypothetical protein
MILRGLAIQISLVSIRLFGQVASDRRAGWSRLELARVADHIRTNRKNANRVFPLYVALERTL